MDLTLNFDILGTSLEVFLIDLLLSGDNAIVIALACRSLGPQHLRKAVLLGTGAAVLLRVLLTLVVTSLLETPGLKLLGAVALVLIAVELTAAEEDETPPAEDGTAADGRLISAIGVIIVADLVMSLDNVVALAAVAQGNAWFLVCGLLLSIPLLMFGSLMITRLLDRWPVLITIGGALLGWIAGGLAVSDPLVASWISTQAPALAVVMPWLTSVFVILEARFVRQRRAGKGHHA